jgi:hypothetical protein
LFAFEIRSDQNLAAIRMLVFVGAALITGSILFLIGPAAIGFSCRATITKLAEPDNP